MTRQSIFARGLKDGVPISLGYFAVALSLGIAARGAGLTAFQAMLASLLNNASAGEFAAFTLIGAGAGYLEVGLMTLVTNARYLLMSCALTQKLDPNASLAARMFIGYDVTDEIFGASIAYPGVLDPHYSYGLILAAVPGWALGTYLGVLMGNALPARVVSALSVSLYGMFIAVIVPPARKNRVIAGLIVLAMGLSWALSALPAMDFLSSGAKVMLLTVALSALAAWRFPVKEEEDA